MKTPFLRLALCAIIFCVGAPLHASIVTYQFSGTHYSSFGSFPGGIPSAFTGTLAYDTSTNDADSRSDYGVYHHEYPLGQSGISIATNTGRVFATDPNAAFSFPSFTVYTFLPGGPNGWTAEELYADGALSDVPAGWTYANATFDIYRTNNSSPLLNSSKALPTSLPTFRNAAERPSNINAFVQIDFLNPSVSQARFKGQVTRLEHASTSSEAAVINTGVPVTTNLGGGTANVGGATVGFTPASAGTFQQAYNTVPLDQLPATAPFTTGNFLLNVPGDTLQYWDLHYTGDLQGPATVTFHFDPSLVTSALPLGIWHYTDGPGWEFLGGTILGDTITVTTDSFSPFALAAVPVPEPSSLTMLAIAGVVLGYRWRRGRAPRQKAVRRSETDSHR
jgi:hypothetical protein